MKVVKWSKNISFKFDVTLSPFKKNHHFTWQVLSKKVAYPKKSLHHFFQRFQKKYPFHSALPEKIEVKGHSPRVMKS
jgi:hypothetical protein